jgi:hypothetical protein
MNKKIMTIASLVFALIFIALFVVMFVSYRTSLGREADSMSDLYAVTLPFDVSLVDDDVVTRDTLVNLYDTIKADVYLSHISMINDATGITVTSVSVLTGLPSGDDKEYSVYSTFNTNGILNAIHFRAI